MQSVLVHSYTGIHLVAMAGLAVLLLHRRYREGFERRCVGTATAIDLAYIRIVVAAVLIVYVLNEDLASQAAMGADWFEPLGYAQPLRGVFRWFLASATRLWLLEAALLVTLLLVLVGCATRLTLPLAAILYLLVAGLLRSFGKNFHEGYLSFYVLLVLCVLPCADAWSVDARYLRPRLARWWQRVTGGGDPVPPTAAYNWAVYACYATVTIPYLQLAFSKLIAGGLYWFDGRSMRNYMINDSLNLSHINVDLGLRLHDAPVVLFTAMGLVAIVLELVYPLVLVMPRLRRFLPLAICGLHVGVWFGQDALFIDAVLIPALIFLRPSQWRWSRGQR